MQLIVAQDSTNNVKLNSCGMKGNPKKYVGTYSFTTEHTMDARHIRTDDYADALCHEDWRLP